MKIINVEFDILENGQIAHVRWKRTSGHMMFDVNMDFIINSIWLLDRHKNPSPEGSVHAALASQESARMSFAHTSLMFGHMTSKTHVCKRAMHGRKEAGRYFRNHLKSYIEHIGFASCLALPDAWTHLVMKQTIKSIMIML